VIAGGGFWFNQQQRERELQIAGQRAQTDQEIADQRRQDDMLQKYLDGMSQMLTDKDRPLHRAQVGDTLSTVARARTLTMLPQIDGPRRGRVLQFLYESKLITKDKLVISLHGANFSRADLARAPLKGVYLFDARLSNANLEMSTLEGAYLKWAKLEAARLVSANLQMANLTGAIVTEEQLAGCESLQ